MKKILVFCAYFYPHEGGVETYVRELFGHEKELDVTIVTCNTEDAKFFEEKDGFHIYRLDSWHMLGAAYPVVKLGGWKQLKRLDSVRFDYVFSNTRFFNISYVAYRFAKRNNIPFIHIEHGTNHSKLTNVFSRFVNIVYDHTIGRQIIKNCFKLVTISDAAKRFCDHIYKRDSIQIRNSIDTKNFIRRPLKKIIALKKKLSIKDEKVIVYVGRLIYAKGVQDLLEAVTDIPNIRVLIIGDGNYSDVLKKRFLPDPRLLFFGKRNSSEIIDYLSISDLFVNPSYAEGLPTSVLEAGAIGLPIIATDVGGTREIIDDAKNGYLIKPKDIAALTDRITILLKDNKKSAKFSSEIRKKIVKEFDWKIAKKVLIGLVKK